MTDPASSPFPFQEIRSEMWDWKFPPSNHMVFSSGNKLQSLVIAISHFISVTRQLCHLADSKSFRSCVPEMGMKIKYIFLIINYNTLSQIMNNIFSFF